MAITGQKGDYDASFELSPEYGQIWYYTDSGGPVLQNNKLIGVLSGLGGCTGSGNKETNPLGCKGYAAFIDPAFITTHVDQDGDGVGDTLDNCPSDPNADQKDCDAVDDGSSPRGDACDPDPCPYPEDATQIFSKSVHGNVAVFYNSNVRVDYRAVGYQTSPTTQDYIKHNMDGYYCACHNTAAPNTPKNPGFHDNAYCITTACPHVKDPADLSNPLDDTGWLRVVWTHYDDTYSFSKTSPSSCTLTNNDSDGQNNDCATPLQNRLFRRPYKDAPTPGTRPGDWEIYWSAAGKDRTRSFRWDWTTQDYPHPQSTPWIPPMDRAKVRLWLRKANHVSATENEHNFG